MDCRLERLSRLLLVDIINVREDMLEICFQIYRKLTQPSLQIHNSVCVGKALYERSYNQKYPQEHASRFADYLIHEILASLGLM